MHFLPPHTCLPTTHHTHTAFYLTHTPLFYYYLCEANELEDRRKEEEEALPAAFCVLCVYVCAVVCVPWWCFCAFGRLGFPLPMATALYLITPCKQETQPDIFHPYLLISTWLGIYISIWLVACVAWHVEQRHSRTGSELTIVSFVPPLWWHCLGIDSCGSALWHAHLSKSHVPCLLLCMPGKNLFPSLLFCVGLDISLTLGISLC